MIDTRLKALRELMAGRKLDVYLVPSSDEHQNEYLPARKMRREAISGFTGSAGDVVVCLDQAHLFVDSRYHLQAEQELGGGAFQVHKMGLAEGQDLPGWLAAHDAAHGPLQVGYDPFVLTLASHGRLRKALCHDKSRLVPVQGNLVDQVWEGRPAASPADAFALPDEITGEPVGGKLTRLREKLAEAGAAALVLSKLDEVAWLTNLRGSDIPYNPVFEAYLVVETEGATCYTDAPLPVEARQALQGLVAFRPYADFPKHMKAVARGTAKNGGSLWLDGQSTSQGIALLAGKTRVYSKSPNPVTAMKAVKNPVEIERMMEGHLKSGCAKVRAFSGLSSLLAEGEPVSERDFAQMLEAEYAREEGFKELSFTTISAFGANGAIVHYATPDPEQMLTDGGLLLVDSGIQILGATTDDTRTIAIGAPTARQRAHFTDVLRAHISLATQVFPEGTNGQMLDAIARSPLWKVGADYGHGTGHGVGAFLNVHEGPQNISPRGRVALEPGMIVSNEPGYYKPGWGGIRLENLMVVEEMMGLPRHPAGRRWLRMTPLTLIPFDRKLIDPSRLSGEERSWVDDYHRWVEQSLLPLLTEPHQAWLAAACLPLD